MDKQEDLETIEKERSSIKLYKVTDESGYSYYHEKIENQWSEGAQMNSSDNRTPIYACLDPLVASFLSGEIMRPLLWESKGEIATGRNTDTEAGCAWLQTVRKIPFPELTARQRLEIAIRCTSEVFFLRYEPRESSNFARYEPRRGCHNNLFDAYAVWTTHWLMGYTNERDRQRMEATLHYNSWKKRPPTNVEILMNQENARLEYEKNKLERQMRSCCDNMAEIGNRIDQIERQRVRIHNTKPPVVKKNKLDTLVNRTIANVLYSSKRLEDAYYARVEAKCCKYEFKSTNQAEAEEKKFIRSAEWAEECLARDVIEIFRLVKTIGIQTNTHACKNRDFNLTEICHKVINGQNNSNKK